MSEPIKFDPNSKIASEEKSRKAPAAPEKFKEVMEDDSRKSAAQLKRHNKNLDSDSEDLEEFGKAQEKKGPSLFDLASSKQPKEKLQRDTTGQEKQEQPEVAMKKSSINKDDSPKVSKESSSISSKNDLGKGGSGKEETPFIAEKPKEDKSMARTDVITPHILEQSASAAVAQVKVEAPQSKSDVQQLMQQIIDRMSEMRYAGKTETVVTLKHPPLFANANIVLTSFDSAKGEFNISFENLSTAAKNFLDSGNHVQDLKAGLEQKGFVAHIVTTTTVEETRFGKAEGSAFARDEKGDQQQQQGEQQDDEEEA